MRIFWLPFLLALCLNIAIDFFIYKQMKKSNLHATHILSRLHVVLAVAAHTAMLVTLLLPLSGNGTMVNAMKVIWCYAMFYVPKFLWTLIYTVALQHFWPKWLKRALSVAALSIALLVMGIMWQGFLTTPYSIHKSDVTIGSPHLPEAFDGYRICHISDLHLGTYGNDTAFVAACVDSINALHPDLIVFTGDLVSRTTSEAIPFKSTLRRLRARDGVLSILGNHDYDDYTNMTAAQRKQDHESLCRLQKECGWTLLNNTTSTLHRAGDSIIVVGTENYSVKHTPDYSRLDSTISSIDCKRNFTILLQHNPQLWRNKVLKNDYAIDLTLSGHTHAMQMMVTMCGKRFSPAQWVYDEWGGLYTQGQRHLYVNIGLGMVGIPARIGSAKPEITLLTLKCSTTPR